MNFKKTVAIAAAAGALAAISVPAMALENEFHGMYKFMGYESNFISGLNNTGGTATGLSANSRSGFVAEQRARLQYTAKANNDLKLVTHFEMDARFGGKATGADTDLGRLDADATTFEIKNVYLDFNAANTNFKVGVQTWADAYQGVFLLADMSGAVVTKKLGAATVQGGWFRLNDDSTTIAGSTAGVVSDLNKDIFILNGKFALNKDMTLGASVYNVIDKSNYVAGGTKLYVYGVDADIKAGPVSIKPFAAVQSGDRTATVEYKGYLLGAVTKTKIGSNAINLSALVLSGDTNASNEKSFANIGAAQSYFNASNMWLLVRSGQAINSSTSVLSNDVTVGGSGLIGVFAGFEGTAGKIFYNANLGYAQTAEKKGTAKSALGTEVNAQVGYKLFDNMSVSAAAAMVFLGDGLGSSTGTDLVTTFGVANADNPYLANVQLSYAF